MTRSCWAGSGAEVTLTTEKWAGNVGGQELVAMALPCACIIWLFQEQQMSGCNGQGWIVSHMADFCVVPVPSSETRSLLPFGKLPLLHCVKA